MSKKIIELETLKPDRDLPSGYLSISQLNMFLSCPKQYYFRYVEGMKIPPGIAMIEGISHHEALEMDNLNKVSKGKPVGFRTMSEKFEDTFSAKRREIPRSIWLGSEDKPDDIIQRGFTLLHKYCTETTNYIKPSEMPEQKIELLFGGVPVLGFIDCTERNRIVDYKVSGKRKNKSEIENDLQLTIYAFATKKRNVAFCSLIKSTGDIVIDESKRETIDFERAEIIVSEVADSIKKGCFHSCNPADSFPCSPKWCGYYRICKGGSRSL